MPRVQRVTERSASPQLGPMPQAQAPSTNPLAIAGQAAGQVSEQVAKIQLDELAKADFAQRTLADTQLNDITSKLSTEATALRGFDALNLPGKYEQKFNEATAGLAGGMRTDEQRTWFEARVADQRNRFLSQLQGHERGETERVYNEVDQQGLKSYTDDVRANFRDEKAVGDNIGKITGLIQNRGKRLGLPQELVDQEIADSASGARVEVVQGWADEENLQQAEAALKRHGPLMSAADRNRAENLVGTLKARKRQEAETAAVLNRFDLTQQMQDIRARAFAGLDVGPLPSQQALVAAFGAERGASMYRDALTWQKAAGAMATVNTRPASEMQGVIDSYLPAEQTGSAEMLQVRSALQSAAQAALVAREKDPGGFLIQTDPKLQSLWQTAISGADANTRATAAKTYLSLAGARAKQLEIANTDLIPAGYGKQFAGALMASESAEASANLLMSEQDKWGDQWPKVFPQLGTNLPGMYRVAGAGIARPAAKTLASLAQLKPDERNSALAAKLPEGTSRADVENAVKREFGQFYATFPSDAPGLDMRGNLHESALVLAQVHVGQGMSARDAAKLTYQELAGGEPLAMVNGSPFRVPSSEAGNDTDTIERGANLLVRGFRADPSMLVGSSPVTPDETYADRLTAMIREDGVLVTTPSADGVALYVGSEPVYRGGKIVTWTWRELAEKGGSPSTFGERLQFAPTAGGPGGN